MENGHPSHQHTSQRKLDVLRQAELALGFAVGKQKTVLFWQSQSKW